MLVLAEVSLTDVCGFDSFRRQFGIDFRHLKQIDCRGTWISLFFSEKWKEKPLTVLKAELKTRDEF